MQSRLTFFILALTALLLSARTATLFERGQADH